MIPLGVLSMVAVAIIMERLWVLRRSNFLQISTVQTLSGLLASDKFRGSIDFCRRHPGPFSDLVIALVENRHAPYEELKEILEDTGRLQLMGLQRGLPALGTIAAGAPLLGLLGTVIGMIKIFAVVATAGSSITEQLSSGISQALITTATGLVIAIPALFVHSYLESRALSILSDIEAQILDFLHLVREHAKNEDEED
jgi:biopolymer transport protein ExbB